MKTRGMSTMAYLLWALAVAAPAISFTAETPDLDRMKQQLQDLQQKVLILERQRELEKEAATEKAKTTPLVSLGAGGLSITSADSNFVFRVRGYIQADGRFYPDDSGDVANDTFLIRRARPIFEGTLFEKFDFRLMLDFGSGATSSGANNAFLQDGYLNARFYPGFQVQAGKMKEPVGLERLQSGANLLFVERAFPTLLLPNRDVGVMVHGNLFKDTLRYEAGVFNGVADGGSADVDVAGDDKDVAARLFATPFRNTRVEPLRGLGFGVAGTFGSREGELRTFVSPGQQRFFGYRTGAGTEAAPNVVADGEHWRVTPQMYYYWGPFGLFAEYALSNQEVTRRGATTTSRDVRNTAWQVSASYVLTGEENSWRGITPKKPFKPSEGGWGAWEIAARVHELDVDDAVFPLYANPATSASGAAAWGVGLNWHLNKNVKLNLDYEQTDFDGGTSPLLRNGEKVIFGRVQVAF